MNLLNRAKKFIQGGSPPPTKPQHYNVNCPEGHRLSGARTEGYQALRCPSCGEGIFILPRSPLPEPPPPPADKHRASSRPAAAPVQPWSDDPITLSDPPPMANLGVVDEEQEIEWEDEVVQKEVEVPVEEPLPPPQRPPARAPERPGAKDSPRAKPAEKSRAAAGQGSPKPVGAARPHAARPSPKAAEIAIPAGSRHIDWREWAQRRRRPLIFAGVGLFILLAVSYRAWQATRANQPYIAMMGRTEGLQALDEGRFDTANQLLSNAKRAVEILRDQVEGAEEIKKGAAEAEIFAKLASDSLEVMLAKASASDPAEWAREFKTFYKGHSVIIDASITRVPDADTKFYELDYAILPSTRAEGGPAPSIGRIDTTGLVLLDQIKPEVGTKLLFGARISTFEFDSSREQWVIGLEPNSGVQISHLKALQALGWPELETATSELRP